jgi:hypothetical protein
MLLSKEKKKEEKGKAEEAAEKTGEVVGKGVKKGFGIAKGIGKGLVKGVKGEEEEKKKKINIHLSRTTELIPPGTLLGHPQNPCKNTTLSDLKPTFYS